MLRIQTLYNTFKNQTGVIQSERGMVMGEIHLGKILAEKRRRRGITQDELAEFMGVSKAAVSKWETGGSLR